MKPSPPNAIVTTEGTCSCCGAKLTNAETARLNWQAEAARLDRELKTDYVKREELRQTVDLLDRMQVTGKVNHEKLQAELLRLESLLNPKT